MLVKTYGAALQGIDATVITIEVHEHNGIGNFTMVGLPDNAVRESRDRVHSAIQVNGYHLPRKTIVINLAPADIKKEGAAYDLPIAIGMLAADEQLPTTLLDRYMIMGELSLDGTLQPIRGALPMAIKARDAGFAGFILPYVNAKEAAVVDGIEVYGMDNLRDVVRFLRQECTIEPVRVNIDDLFADTLTGIEADFADVRGQESVKRALEVAAAGGHNILMVGPPGAGKSMMAKRMPGIMPPLTLDEALETTKIHSVAGIKRGDISLITTRPFRSPHHTISDVALVGGGSNAMPGEISLAHNGVLFLDELPEYKRQVLEVLRQPLEDGKMCVSRSKLTVTYPSRFMLVAAMNPCPCGHYGDPLHECTCSPGQVQRYMSRISGPLLDRIDIHCHIQSVPFADLQKMSRGESSASIRERVVQARRIQTERFAGVDGVHCNAMMTERMLHQYAAPDAQGLNMLRVAMERLRLSARAYSRILKVARTVADLAGAEKIEPSHIAEAISYRALDREDMI